MFSVLIYTTLAALGVTSAQAFRPSIALRTHHQRRIYWMGAAVSVGLVSLFASAFIV